MKKYLIKTLFLALATTAIVSCTKDDDFVTPSFKEVFYIGDFEDHRYGSGSTDVNVDIEGTINVNLEKTIKTYSTTNPGEVISERERTSDYRWNVRRFSNNNYMQFSSFYSENGSDDDVWYILPAAKLTANEILNLSFVSQFRYLAGTMPVSVVYSSNFDGTTAGITAAEWTELEYNKPTVPEVYVGSGSLAITNSSTQTKDFYIAFRYKGSKRLNNTTTIQIDKILLSK